MTERKCATCPSSISARNKSGQCRKCVCVHLNSDPAIKANRIASMKAHWEQPEVREAAAERARIMCAKMTDADREKRREHGRRQAPILIAANRLMSKEKRIDNGRKRTETVLAWCPPEWRQRYRDIKMLGRRAAVAKRMVLDEMAGRPAPVMYAQQRSKLAWCPDSRRAEYEDFRKTVGAAEARRIIEADFTPFERMQSKVAQGAQLIAKPVYRRADPAYSLVGNATAML